MSIILSNRLIVELPEQAQLWLQPTGSGPILKSWDPKCPLCPLVEVSEKGSQQPICQPVNKTQHYLNEVLVHVLNMTTTNLLCSYILKKLLIGSSNVLVH